jgi:RsiW-degrading membrane proteinase PrsW (M82 family)
VNPRYRQALLVAGIGMVALVLGITVPGPSALVLLIGSAAIPVAALLVVAGRLQATPPLSSVVGGASVGVVIAVIGHAVVFGFAYVFFLGFAEAAVEAMEVLRVDPRFTEVASSPWAILLLIELVLVAPLIEEVGKAVGAVVFRPNRRSASNAGATAGFDRRGAFMAGVAAGTGFAIVENILYALSGGFLGPSWEPILIVRILGAAVHPLASGLVVMGWWEWRQTRDLGLLAQRFLAGAGLHAIWNASIVLLSVVATAYGGVEGFGLTSLAYAAALGAVFAAALWRLTHSVAAEDEAPVVFDSADGRVVAAWTVLAASFLLPVALLVLAFPAFVAGG